MAVVVVLLLVLLLERWRTKERARERGSHFDSSVAPVFGGLCRPLVRAGRQGVDLDCHSRGAFLSFPELLEFSRPPPLCLRGPFNFAPLEPDRGRPSGGGPPVGGKGILPDCGPLGDLLTYLNHVYFDGKLFHRPQ